jgi:hypothetical protein
MNKVIVNDDSIVGKGEMSSSGFHYRSSDYEIKNNAIYIKSYGSYIPSISRTINKSNIIFKFDGNFKNIDYVYVDGLPLWFRDKK